MADKFVWDGGDNTDGLAWDTAWTSLMRDWSVEASFTPATDVVYVRSIHSQDQAADLQLWGEDPRLAAPVRIYSVTGAASGTTVGTLAAGALEATNGGANQIVINGYVYIYGVNFHSADNLKIGDGGDGNTIIENSTLKLIGTSGADSFSIGSSVSGVTERIRLYNCNIDLSGHAAQGIAIQGCDFLWRGGAFVSNVTYMFESSGGRGSVGRIRCENLDLSAMSGTLVGPNPEVEELFEFLRCELHASVTLTAARDETTTRVLAAHCQDGTDTDPAYQMHYEDFRGSVEADVSTYRTGGASDDERSTPISWKISTLNGTDRFDVDPLESPAITGWVEADGATEKTFTIEIASGSTQQDNDIFFVLKGPKPANGAVGSQGFTPAGGPTPGTLFGTRVDPLDTPTNYPSSGAWAAGSDRGTPQKMSLAYTPEKSGPISVIVYMASDAGIDGDIYVDPKVTIT